MTDLLGLLSGLHAAVSERGVVRLTITDVEGHNGAIDTHTNTIHISPGLTLPAMLRVLADGVNALAPAETTSTGGQLAVGGGGGEVAVPTGRHLWAVRDLIGP
jgi:hypothetical protein